MSAPPLAAILPGRAGGDAAVRRCSGAIPRLLLRCCCAAAAVARVVYLGSLFALLAQSFFSIDEFSGLIAASSR
jgi:putative spermidine/putrescine transport system permease protein